MTDTPFDIVRSDLLDGVPHGFFGHAGGAHQFGYGGPGDAEDVRLLRAAAAKQIVRGAPIAAPHQVHSPEVVTIGKLWPDAAEGRPVADAVVTERPDIVLAIVTADCAPVLLADRQARVVGAAHAGWRGAVGNERGSVLTNTIAAMEALGAQRERIAAVIGPTIAQPSYEVDDAFRAHFSEADGVHFATAPMREGLARWHFDLPGYVAACLANAGVGAVDSCALDTYRLENHYFSYRRAMQQGLPNYGRNLSAIGFFP